jgi:hypothetical protein
MPINAMPLSPTRSELRRFAWVVLCLGPTLAGFALSGQARAQQAPGVPLSASEQCRSIKDAAGRLRCYEGATAKPDSTANSLSSVRAWPLVRTPNPAGGAEAVSIMQTADTAKSDLDLAGLMLRCGERNIETLVVLIRPFPPRAHPKVRVAAGAQSREFTATVQPPGVALLLPAEATALAAGPWQSATELAVQVDDESSIRGIISLQGLGPAYRLLIENCFKP